MESNRAYVVTDIGMTLESGFSLYVCLLVTGITPFPEPLLRPTIVQYELSL